MSDSVRVRVVRAQFRYDREQYTEGDKLDVPEHVLERHPRSLAVVEETGAEAKPDTDADQTDSADAVEPVAEADLDPHPSDLTVDELRDRLTDVGDLALLYDIRAAEGDGKTRETALEAIDARISDVEG